MNPEAMKQLYRTYIDEVWTHRRLDGMERFFTRDHRDLDAPPGQGEGLEGLQYIMGYMQSAFPDCAVRIDDLYVDGDTLIACITFSGTHQGEFFGIGPTGRAVQVGQIHVMRFRDGKLAEHRSKSDDLLMMRQLGVVPEMASTSHTS